LNDQGLAAFKAGLFNEASNYFLESIKANPADIEALNNYGYAQLKSDHFPVAENALGYLLAIAPGRTSGWANLGELYANTNRPDAAVAAFVVGFQFSTNKQMALDFLRSTSLNADTSPQLKVVIERVLNELSR
jgi:tetratricopeptide (TPR) repeat protein